MATPMLAPDLDTHIALSRERKARVFARTVWESLEPGARQQGIAEVEAAPTSWWRAVAERIGERMPSVTTRALVIEKLHDAYARRRD